MPEPTLTFKTGVTLLGAGPVDAQTLDAALSRAPNLIAADGGAETARALKKRITAIVGDLDSLTSREYWRNSGIPMFEFDEQETTDFEKCLYATDAPLTLAVGFAGGRLDHQLAVFSALIRRSDRRVIVMGDEDVVFACPPRLEIDLPPGCRFSIFPFSEIEGVVSEGLTWSVEGLRMAPDGRIGTSNKVGGSPVKLSFDRTGALIILPAPELPAAVAALDA